MRYYVCLDSKKRLLTSVKGKLLRRDRIRGDVVFNPGVNKVVDSLTFALEVTWASHRKSCKRPELFVCLFLGWRLVEEKLSLSDPTLAPLAPNTMCPCAFLPALGKGLPQVSKLPACCCPQGAQGWR